MVTSLSEDNWADLEVDKRLAETSRNLFVANHLTRTVTSAISLFNRYLVPLNVERFLSLFSFKVRLFIVRTN